MGAKENLAAVEQLREAITAGDRSKIDAVLADDCTMRMAGVPASMGGVVKGRDAIAAFYAGNVNNPADIKSEFADDNNVCVVTKMQGTQFPGNEYLKGGGAPFTTYGCSVYSFRDGQITEMTNYVNWLDVYVQSGVVDVGSLLA
jgi:ketosteroid isomerase-like protein